MVESALGEKCRTQDRGGCVQWAGQGDVHGRCDGSRGPDAGSGVVSGAVGCLASVVTGRGCPAGGIRALSLTLWPLPWRSGVLNRLLVWRRSLCFVLLVQIFSDIKLP